MTNSEESQILSAMHASDFATEIELDMEKQRRAEQLNSVNFICSLGTGNTEQPLDEIFKDTYQRYIDCEINSQELMNELSKAL